MTMTATNRPDIAGSASSRFGIIETNAIRATDSAAKTALRAILDVFFISRFIYQPQQHGIRSPPMHSQQQSAQSRPEQTSQAPQPLDDLRALRKPPFFDESRFSFAAAYSRLLGSILHARSKFSDA